MPKEDLGGVCMAKALHFYISCMNAWFTYMAVHQMCTKTEPQGLHHKVLQ